LSASLKEVKLPISIADVPENCKLLML